MRQNNQNNILNKKAQVAIYVIIAIVIVLGIVAYFFVSGKISIGEINPELAQAYSYYSSCIESKARTAIDIVGSQGGRIDTGTYIPGSEYAPFSSQLNFLGFPVPYWFYVSGNGIVRENVPTEQDIENEISEYVQQRMSECDYTILYDQGYSFDFGNPDVKTTISDSKVTVSVSNPVRVSKGELSAVKTDHQIEIASKLGKFYNIALQIYNQEKNTLFLENYSLDVLRLYAPVDGVDTSCSARTWSTQEVVSDLKQGLVANIGAIRFNNQGEEYFSVGNIDENVNLQYSSTWPTRVQIYGDSVNNALMVAQPLGNDAGLGAMGFCYTPYHFVYDLSFPVLIQVYNDNEIFQFPVVVVLDKNMPREATLSNISVSEDFDLCAFNTQNVIISTYDISLNKINSNLSFKCLNQECAIGQTENGVFSGSIPACVNGEIIVRAEGYAEKKQIFSSNTESISDIILDREYSEFIEVEVGGTKINENVVAVFENKDNGKIISAVLPGFNNIKLSEGNYAIKVYAYGNSSINIPESTKTECTEVPKPGVLGFFGGKEEKCIDITIPGMKIEHALIGGGNTEDYFLVDGLSTGKVTLKAESLPRPTTVEQLQYNFQSFDSLNLEVQFG